MKNISVKEASTVAPFPYKSNSFNSECFFYADKNSIVKSILQLFD